MLALLFMAPIEKSNFTSLNSFNDLTINPTTQMYNFSFKMLNSTYQNYVLQDNTLKAYWRKAMASTPITNENGTQFDNAFHQICNFFCNLVDSCGHDIAAGNLMLHFIQSKQKKLATMSPQKLLTCFKKSLKAVKVLDHWNRH